MKDDGKPSLSAFPSSKTEENMGNSKQKLTKCKIGYLQDLGVEYVSY